MTSRTREGPVLPVPLSVRHAFVDGLQGLRVPVHGGQEPGAKVVRKTLARIVLPVEPAALCRLEDFKAPTKVIGLIMDC